MNAILAWLVKAILDWLLNRTVKEGAALIAKAKLDAERGHIDDANLKKYDEASSRAERVKAALALLNGDSTP